MSSKKGFDPLASLFDGPDLGDFTEPGSEEVEIPHPESSDPGISMPADGSLAALRGEQVSLAPFISDSEHTDAIPADPLEAHETQVIVRPRSLKLPDEDTIMTARSGAMLSEFEPVSVNQDDEATDDHTHVDSADLARALARAAMSAAPAGPVSVPQQEPTPATEERDVQQLARDLAKVALSRSPEAVQVPRKTAPKAPKTRGQQLSARAARPKGALQAAKDAEEAEADRIRKRAPKMVKSLIQILKSELKGARKLRVVNALQMEDRMRLEAVWKAYRATFAARGNLSGVIATSTIIAALRTAPRGTLVAAIVETETSDYLV